MTYIRPVWRMTLLTLLGIALSACGGGSSSSGSASPVPRLIFAFDPLGAKNFRFSWADAAGETEYRLLEDPDGASGYTRVATIAADSTSHDLNVFLPARLNARYILQACNGAGCVDSAPVHVSGNLAGAVGYVKASNTRLFQAFGYSLALSSDGRTLAVGALAEGSNAQGIDGDQSNTLAPESGAVYVYSRGTGGWALQAYVKSSNSEASDYFGEALALSGDGNTLVVSATGEDSNATGVNGDPSDNSAIASGAVYVYTRAGNSWSQQAYLKASNTSSADRFGQKVALSADGNTLAVGATGEDSAATDSGAVYVFSRTGNDWAQQAYVKASNADAEDRFGGALALSADGNTLAVGTPSEDSNATGIGGDETNNTAPDFGAIYVFSRAAGTWSQQAYLKASQTDEIFFGSGVALSSDGHTLAAGARERVTLFERSGSTWALQAAVNDPTPGVADRFGLQVSLSADGQTLAVGAYFDASASPGLNGNPADTSAANSGAVHVYARRAGSWTPLAYVKAPNPGAGDRFGNRVALSGDGQTLAVGTHFEDSNATGIQGDQNNNSADDSGAVYLY